LITAKVQLKTRTDTVRLSSSAAGSGATADEEEAARRLECFIGGEKAKANFLKHVEASAST
jgi:hypothetical protein